MYFSRQSWQDDRLKFSPVTSDVENPDNDYYNIDSSFVDKIWRPDIFYGWARKGKRHKVSRDNLALDITVRFHSVETTVRVMKLMKLYEVIGKSYTVGAFDHENGLSYEVWLLSFRLPILSIPNGVFCLSIKSTRPSVGCGGSYSGR